MKNIFNLWGGRKQPERQTVVVVSGLPRSGTSMMMKILDAGGLPPVTDKLRTADSDNPAGYYEFERVKKLPEGDVAWLAEAEGKAVKVLAILLFYLPDTYNYQVIFMRRSMPEILASQRRMLINRGEDPDKISDEELSVIYDKYFKQAYDWMNRQANVEQIDVDYNELVQRPRPQLERVNQFLGNTLDVDRMVDVIDPSLYRQRR